MSIRAASGLPFVHAERPRLTGPRRLARAAFDRGTALFLLLLVLPVLLAIAIGIKLTVPGPVLTRRERVGEGGRLFGLYRFRTCDLEDRPTAIGSLLHRYSLDELPQLLNVVRGQVSLVGPRPLPPEALHQEGHPDGTVLARPGLTGLDQAGGRLRSEVNWSLVADLGVLYRTVGAALRGDRRH